MSEKDFMKGKSNGKTAKNTEDIQEIIERVQACVKVWESVAETMDRIPETQEVESKTCLLQIQSSERAMGRLEDLARNSIAAASKALAEAKRGS